MISSKRLANTLLLSVALGITSTAAAQNTATQPRLEVLTRQGDYYWVVETEPDGSQRGGWVGVNVPLDRIDRTALRPLPPTGAVQPSPPETLPPSPNLAAPPVNPPRSEAPPAPVRQPQVAEPVAQATVATPYGQVRGRMLYISPTDDGFQVYLAAAITKKNVPVTVVNRPDIADFTLTAGQVQIKQESTGSKIARCLFAYCAGAEDKGNTSVQLVDSAGIVKWSYSVNKGRGNKNLQSMAEAIAKHLKDEFFSAK